MKVRDFLAHRDILVSASTGPLRISGFRQRQWSTGAQSYLAAFMHLFDRKPSQIVVFTLTRDPDALPLRALPALSNPIQKVIAGAPDLPLLWRDAPGNVVVRSVMGTEKVPPSAVAGASISINALPVDVSVSGTVGTPITWHIVAADRPPAPPWRSSYPERIESADRVAAAAWILTSGPADWRLFALGELRDLSPVEPLADRLWRAVRSGDWLGEPKT